MGNMKRLLNWFKMYFHKHDWRYVDGVFERFGPTSSDYYEESNFICTVCGAKRHESSGGY